MDNENLVRMANQIGIFFAAMPDQEAAQKDIVAHIERTWEPRMIKAMQTHLQQGGAGLSDSTKRALEKLAW